MKHFGIALAVSLILSACSRPYDETTSAIPAAAGGSDNPYYYGEQSTVPGLANNPYGSSNSGNLYGNGSNPYGGESAPLYGTGSASGQQGYSYNQLRDKVNSYGTANNSAAAYGDYYRDPQYGVNVTGGPKATGKDRIIYFSYDSSRLDARAEAVLREHARYLKAHPQTVVVLEGHTDERGSREYNIALGERRAYSVKQQFQRLGVNTQQMRVLSYGEERPAAWGADEGSYAKNRRTVIIY